jgi:glucosamine--fructose-6-phosphate aminotransferase (isomerizing)
MNGTIMLKEILEQGECIEKCHAYNADNLIKLAAIINDFKPQNIVIVGRGTSIHAGIYAKHIFELYYHLPVSIAAQSIFTIYDSYTDMSKSLVIGISQSGGGKDTVTVLKKAREKGALTVGIVNNLESDLAKNVEHVLYCNAGRVVAYPATKTFTTTIYLITRLVYELTKNEQLSVSVEGINAAIQSAIDNRDLIKEKVKPFINIKDLLILGRGSTLSLAMEAGLKIKESSHINVNSYPISEFYHGPIAMLNKDIPAIIIGTDGNITNDVRGILGRLKEKGIPILLITNDKTLIYDNEYILSTQSNEIEAYFFASVVIQLLSCELSILKGYNPDYDESLDGISTF